MTGLTPAFWSKFSFDGVDGCWLWDAAIFRDTGYGAVRWHGRTRAAHAVAYEELVGPVPSGLELDHVCRNRACVNPAHLQPVTHIENVRRALPFRAPFVRSAVCRNGHPRDESNLRLTPRGWARCKACAREKQRHYIQRRRLADFLGVRP